MSKDLIFIYIGKQYKIKSFISVPGLLNLKCCSIHINYVKISYMPRWRNGRRAGLKIQWEHSRAGSSPALGTNVIIYFKERLG